MSLEELQRVVVEYVKHRAAGRRYEVLAHEIADCLTDSTPITRERLIESGFGPHALGEGDGLFIIIGRVKVTWNPFEKFGIFSHWPIEDDGFIDHSRGCYIVPFPQTMGDVAYLLLRLSREEHQ